MVRTLVLLPLLIFGATLAAQKDFYKSYAFTAADTLRGALRPERTCYDVTFYELDIRVDPKQRSIAGHVDIHYRAMADFSRLQIDLYDNMQIDAIEFRGKPLPFQRRFNAVFIDFPAQRKGETGVFRVNYQGRPTVAANPPWDGGFVWSADVQGDPWIGVACEGDGASLWWPNKDHLSDEPDSMSIRVAVPRGLTCVSNGNLRGKQEQGDDVRFDWFVSYPINTYNVTLNIARYAHFEETYTAGDGQKLNLDYYVLRESLAKARRHFQQVQKVLACYERFFGKYPFWHDGFGMVETPYLGMEHQGAIAYGNGYQRGYLGGMIPRGMDWDYIIVHETAHEYFGNSISCGDLSEMWIHESFATYMEALYIECVYSYKDAIGYLAGQQAYINNQEPVIGPYGVNWDNWRGSDHYYKGAMMLNTLRHAIGDDNKWWDILKGFYQKHAISIATTNDFVEYVNAATGKSFDSFFQQYLRYTDIPALEYKLSERGDSLTVRCRWQSDVEGFDMPVLVGLPGSYQRIQPTTKWKEFVLKGLKAADFKVATDLFYVRTKS